MILTKRKYWFNAVIYAVTLPVLLLEIYTSLFYAVAMIPKMEDVIVLHFPMTQSFFLSMEIAVFPLAVVLLFFVYRQRNKQSKIAFWFLIGSCLFLVAGFYAYMRMGQPMDLLGIFFSVLFGQLAVIIISFIVFNTKNFVELTKQYRKGKEEQSQ